MDESEAFFIIGVNHGDVKNPAVGRTAEKEQITRLCSAQFNFLAFQFLGAR